MEGIVAGFEIARFELPRVCTQAKIFWGDGIYVLDRLSTGWGGLIIEAENELTRTGIVVVALILNPHDEGLSTSQGIIPQDQG